MEIFIAIYWNIGAEIMYRALFILFFIVVCLTALLFTSLKDSFYTFF
ncbi:hypothetical protein [Heyndrickxia oleronia]|nr:hypothetical protein [Heyndrickxia oleronia]